MGIFGLVFALLLTLKLSGLASISWLVVFTPVLILAIPFVLFFVITFFSSFL